MKKMMKILTKNMMMMNMNNFMRKSLRKRVSKEKAFQEMMNLKMNYLAMKKLHQKKMTQRVFMTLKTMRLQEEIGIREFQLLCRGKQFILQELK